MPDALRYPTLADAAKAAVDCQNACNASGVALSMFEAARTIRADADIKGGPNQHPIMQLFAYKLASLCISEPMDQTNQDIYTAALNACDRIIGDNHNADGAQS